MEEGSQYIKLQVDIQYVYSQNVDKKELINRWYITEKGLKRSIQIGSKGRQI